LLWTDLADQASKKYKPLREAVTWKSKDAEKQCIVALTSAITDMTKAFAKTLHPHPKKPKESEQPNEKEWMPWKESLYSEWKTIAPKISDPQEKVVKEHIYYGCPNHGKAGMWVAHKPSECKIKGKSKGSANANEKKGEEKKTTFKPTLKPSSQLTAAMTAIKKTAGPTLVIAMKVQIFSKG